MFKPIASLLCFLSVETCQKVPQQVQYDSYEFSETLKDANFELVRAQFTPILLKAMGNDIENLCHHKFMDERAQFINRYMNVIALQLSRIPEKERNESLQSIQLCIPNNEAEFKYIHGTFAVQIAPRQYKLRENFCWSSYHKTITERIDVIKQELSQKR